jgi:ABC-type transport system involved in cytochrome c biogenesis permease subunit
MGNVAFDLFASATAGYFLAFAAGLRPLVRGQRRAGLPAACILWAAFAIQTLALVLQGLAKGHCPAGSPMEVVQLASWFLVALFLLVQRLFLTGLPGAFASALAAAFCAVSLAFPREGFAADPPALVVAHAALSLFAYGAFSLLALTSAMYLIQLRGLRRRLLTGMFGLLPSLRELDAVGQRLLHAGVLVFSVALAFGAAWYIAGRGEVGHAKLAMASAVWVVYAAMSVIRLRGGLHGRRLAVAAMAAFALALAALYPVGHRNAPEADPQTEAAD